MFFGKGYIWVVFKCCLISGQIICCGVFLDSNFSVFRGSSTAAVCACCASTAIVSRYCSNSAAIRGNQCHRPSSVPTAYFTAHIWAGNQRKLQAIYDVNYFSTVCFTDTTKTIAVARLRVRRLRCYIWRNRLLFSIYENCCFVFNGGCLCIRNFSKKTRYLLHASIAVGHINTAILRTACWIRFLLNLFRKCRSAKPAPPRKMQIRP